VTSSADAKNEASKGALYISSIKVCLEVLIVDKSKKSTLKMKRKVYNGFKLDAATQLKMI